MPRRRNRQPGPRKSARRGSQRVGRRSAAAGRRDVAPAVDPQNPKGLALATSIAHESVAASGVPAGLVLPQLGELGAGRSTTDRRIGVAKLGLAMLDAGVARPEAWTMRVQQRVERGRNSTGARAGQLVEIPLNLAPGTPEGFLVAAIEDWFIRHGSVWLFRRCMLWCSVTPYLLHPAMHARDGEQFFLKLHPSAMTRVMLGSVLEWARDIDPRFAPTIFATFTRLREIVGVWDYTDARKFAVFLAEQYDDDPAEAERQVPTPSALATVAGPAPWPQLEALSEGWQDLTARRVMRAIARVHRALDEARSIQRLPKPDDADHKLEDALGLPLHDPLPTIIVKDHEGDIVDATFDQAFANVMDYPIWPNVAFEIPAPTVEHVARVFGDLALVLRALRAVVHLLDVLPGQAHLVAPTEWSERDVLAGLDDDEASTFAPIARDLDRRAVKVHRDQVNRAGLAELAGLIRRVRVRGAA